MTNNARAIHCGRLGINEAGAEGRMSLTQRRPAHDDVRESMPESKALRLARYLKEFVGLRSTTVYDVNKYESVLWFGDMPQEPECQSPAWKDEFAAGDP